MTRHKTIQALEQAMAAADRGDYAAGRSLLQASVDAIMRSPSHATGNAIVLASLEDLNQAIKKTQNASEYRSMGGKASMCETMTSHTAQRSTYSNSMKMNKCYQTSSSDMMQESASVYKKSSKK